MKILVYSAYPQSPHLETDLELICRLNRDGHNVTIVRCTGQLRSCLVNPNHSSLICTACKSKYQNAFRAIDLEGINVISLPIIPQVYEKVPRLFRDIEELKAFQYDGVGLGFSIASTLIGRFYDHRFDTIKYWKEVYRELCMAVDVYNSWKDLLAKHKPDEVYFFNGRFSSYHPLKTLCERNSITFYTHERAGVNNKYILRKNALPHSRYHSLIELEECWSRGGPDKEEVGATFFTNRRNRVVQAWVSFTESQRKGLLPPSFDPLKKNVVIFNSTMEEYEGMEDWKNPLYLNDNIGIRKIVESFRDDKDYMFYLRVHPNMKLRDNTQTREIELIARENANLYLIRPEESYDSYALLDHAFRVVTFGSTVGVEATFWSKVSILFGQSFYMNIDACYQPKTHEEGVALLKDESLKPKDKINAIKYGYWELTKGQKFEYFEQTGLFSVAAKGKIIQPSALLRVMEKFAKLGLIRNRKDVDKVLGKVKGLFQSWL